MECRVFLRGFEGRGVCGVDLRIMVLARLRSTYRRGL